MVKKGKLSFFYAAHNVLLTPLPFHFYFSPLPQFYYFPSSIFSSFIPSSSSIMSTIVLFSLLILDFPPPQFLLCSLLNLDFPAPPPPHLFYVYIFPSTNTWTSYRPCINPRLNFFSTLLRE